jgi:hypothetical protein
MIAYTCTKTLSGPLGRKENCQETLGGHPDKLIKTDIHDPRFCEWTTSTLPLLGPPPRLGPFGRSTPESPGLHSIKSTDCPPQLCELRS